MIRLRSYQDQAIAACWDALSADVNRVAVQLPTGCGKTITFAAAIDTWLSDPIRIRDSRTTERALVLVHTDELVRQAVDKIRLVTLGRWSIGVVKADQNEITADIIVASVQTLANLVRRAAIEDVGLIVVDECFPAGTLVGGRPIESLRPGDMVPSWDERTGTVTSRPVVALMKKRPAAMVRVSLDDGREFDCTPNHPILTDSGWCPAGGLWRGASVVSFAHDANASSRDLHGMLSAGPADHQSQDRRLPEVGSNLLPGRVSGRMDVAREFATDGGHEPPVRLGAHEGAQPDGPTGSAGQDAGHAQADRAQAEPAPGQWASVDRAAASISGLLRLAHRSGDRTGGRGAAVPLPGGHRAPDDESGGGSGRGVPLLAGPPSLRPSQGSTPRFSRVDCVQILEPGSDGTYSGVCPDGFVYNIEVADTHTYLINDGVVVHNCHHAVAPTYRAILEHFGGLPDCAHRFAEYGNCSDCYNTGWTGPPVPVLGFTATLVRSDGQGLGQVWQDLAFSRSLSWAIRKGYLVDLAAYRIEVPDLDAGASDAVLDAMLCDSIAPAAVVTSWMSTVMTDPSGAGPSTVLFAPLVKSAEAFADAFNAIGVKAEVVHGALPAAERRAILERYDAGVTTVVCNAMVLTEGWDSPRTKCVIVARPTKSVPLFVQMVGRGLRPWLGPDAPPRDEQRCVLLCVADSTTELATIADLSDRRIEAADGASLIAMEDEFDIGAHLAAEASQSYAGPVVAREFDPLVARSSKVWAFTDAGHPFLVYGMSPDYIFLVHEADRWSVFWYARGTGARRILRNIPDLELAMALAEDEANDRGGDTGRMLAEKGKPWRKARPSENQMEYAVRVGIPVRYVEQILSSKHGQKAGRLADMITKKVASKFLDPMVERIHARTETVVPPQ